MITSLPQLATLQDDTSDYVRRSVANHLNDIAKDHPAVVAAWLEEHLVDASPERRALLKKRPNVQSWRRLLEAARTEHELSLAPAQREVG